MIDDNTSIYVQDDTPNNETQYRARFYLNPNSLTMAGGDILDLFTGRNASTDVVRIQLQKNGATYQVRAGLLNDAGAWTDTSWYDVPNAWSAVEIHYQAFSNSGSLTLWLDDVQKQSLIFIDNDTRAITDVRLGAQGVDTNTSGTLYFDDFESRRFSYIGTLTDPGVDDPTATNQPGWFARTYTYSATIPHAVTSVNPETGSADTYEYDENGNMTCRIENGVAYTHTYNAENRASSIAKRNTNCTGAIIESWSFAYDGDGVRVSTAHFTGTSGTPDSTTSYYMGGQFEVKDGATKKYYSLAGMMVAVNDGTGLQYLLTDHLGSTVAVTNQSGTLTSQQRYLPFGAARTIPNSPILGTDFTYTGQRDLGDMGLMDYKARFYSSRLGRFIQPDTVIPNPMNPQNWNRFSYVHNNPVKYNDPSGHWIETAFDLAMVAVDIGDIRENGLNWGNGLSLAADVASVIIPGVPAIGALILKSGKIGKTVLTAAKHGDDLVDAVKAAENLVKFGDKADDAKKWIGSIVDVSTHNADSSHVVLGAYDYYIKYAEKAKTVIKGQGHTYFDMPKEVWEILKDGDSWKSVNRQFVLDQIEQGKRFLGQLGPSKTLGEGLKLELDILDEFGRKIKWLK